MVEIFFAYIAGLLTLINPCVLPVLPLVLASAVNVNQFAPVVFAAGLSFSFVLFGMVVTTLGHSIGLSSGTLANIGASVMIMFGLVLLVPQLGRKFEFVTAGISGAANQRLGMANLEGLNGQFFGGVLLGAVWSPCIGPTLGGAIALASQGQNLLWATIIMAFFALGVSTIIIGLGFGTSSIIKRRIMTLQPFAIYSKTIVGAIYVVVGIAIIFKFHYTIETWAVNVLPIWIQDFSVAF